MTDSEDFESKHPMATVRGKGNRFVPKGTGHSKTTGHAGKIRKAIVGYTDDDPDKVDDYIGAEGHAAREEARQAKEHVPLATGFANKVRKNSRHHEQHARAMGYKNQKEYERAGCDFFNSNRGKLYYGIKRKRFYRYDEKTEELAISDNGVLHTYMPMSNKEFNKKINEEQLYE